MIKFSEILQEAIGTKMNWRNAKKAPTYATGNNESKNFDTIKKSIETLSAITCYYKNAWVNGKDVTYFKRDFEPFMLLKNKKGNRVVLGYFTNGYTQWGMMPPFRTYLLSQFRQIRIIPRKTRIVRPDFRPDGFKGMQVLVNIMDYAKIKNKKNQKIVSNLPKVRDNVKRNDLDNIEEPKYKEPEDEPTGEFEDDDDLIQV